MCTGGGKIFGVLISLIVSKTRQNTWRVSAYEPLSVVVLLYWLGYFGYTLAYAMVSLEMRYLKPVEPFSKVIGATYLAIVGRRLMNTRQVVE